MDFSYDAMIGGPVDRVLELLRDRLTDLVPYLPTVDSISERERGVEGDRIRIINDWQGNSRSVPMFAKPFVTKAMTAWHDVAEWDLAARSIKWEFVPNKFRNLYTCEGTNYLEEIEGQTRLQINGSLVIHPEHLPMPRRMAKRFAPRIAKWAVGKVRPNLLEIPKAVQAFFDEERRAEQGA